MGMKMIITAGGQGKKVWPLSREAKPKHFQKIVGDISSYQHTVESLLKSKSADDIFVSTKRRYYSIAAEQSPQIPKKNYILEPDISKDRGPGEGLAFLELSNRHPDEPFMIVQGDNLRFPEEKFSEMIEEAEIVERRDKQFMSGGIKANYPILGIDYIKLGQEIATGKGLEIYKVDQFIPRNNDYRLTKQLIEDFHVCTHSNHNCWYPELMLSAYQKYRPDWYEALMKIRDINIKSGSEAEIDNAYSQMTPGPTEEVTKHLFNDGYIILLPFKWIDIGTWDSVYEYMDVDGGVYADGNVVSLNSHSSLVKCDNPEKIVAISGLENMVIIDTADALLVIPKDKSSDVGELVKLMQSRGLKKYL